jgi:hypothetical protein
VGIFDNCVRCGRGRIVNVKKGVGVVDWSLLCFQRFSEDLGSFLWLFFTFSSLFRLFAWYGIGCIYRFVICRARLFVLFFSLIFGMRFLCACAGVYMKRNWDLNMFLLTSILSAK